MRRLIVTFKKTDGGLRAIESKLFMDGELVSAVEFVTEQARAEGFTASDFIEFQETEIKTPKRP